MDSVIHYERDDALGVIAGLAARRASGCCSPSRRAPRCWRLMHAVGQFFPRSDRSPAIVPVAERKLRDGIEADPELDGWRVGRTRRISARLLHLAGDGAESVHEPAPAIRPNFGVSGSCDVLPRFLPFSDAATTELPLPRLLRLALFQGSVGMTMVLLYGTLNRVMVVEMGVPAWLVSLMVALPVLFAPLRALIGFKSDVHRSAFGLRRIPYLWFGSLMQFGGLAIMPFALLLLAEGGNAPPIVGSARRGGGLPARGCRPAHDADRWPRAGHGHRAERRAARAWWRCCSSRCS
jgi:hypothetical protein